MNAPPPMCQKKEKKERIQFFPCASSMQICHLWTRGGEVGYVGALQQPVLQDWRIGVYTWRREKENKKENKNKSRRIKESL